MNNHAARAILVALAAASACGAADVVDDIDPSEISVRVETVGPSILPFQAARVRVVVKNLSNRKFGLNVQHIARNYASCQLKAPDQAEFRTISSGLLYSKPPGMGLYLDRPYRPISLSRDQTLSHSFPLMAEWSQQEHPSGNPLLKDVSARPLFDVPGQYVFRYVHPCGGVVPRTVVAETTIEVKAPDNPADRDILQMLRDDPSLFVALAHPPWVSPTVDAVDIARLERVRARHPASTYSDYASLAISRAHMRHRTESMRVMWARATDALAVIGRREFPLWPSVVSRLHSAGPWHLMSLVNANDVEPIIDSEELRSIKAELIRMYDLKTVP